MQVAHPEWHLKTDKGVPVDPPCIDVTVPEAREWWLGVPFNATAGWTPGLIDGILADDSGYNVYTGISDERLQERYVAPCTSPTTPFRARHKISQ
jgi:hypothetical protein